jgi:hypothetical protein
MMLKPIKKINVESVCQNFMKISTTLIFRLLQIYKMRFLTKMTSISRSKLILLLDLETVIISMLFMQIVLQGILIQQVKAINFINVQSVVRYMGLELEKCQRVLWPGDMKV